MIIDIEISSLNGERIFIVKYREITGYQLGIIFTFDDINEMMKNFKETIIDNV